MDGVVDPSSAPTPESRERLLTLVMSHRLSQAVYVVTRLGIPDLLADGPRETDELAHATGSHAPSLHRVLLALAGAGVLEKVGPRRFALTSVGAGLRTGVPGSLRPGVLLSLDESLWRPWGHLLHTVRTGETAFHHAHGVGLFDYLAGHPEVARVFDDAMSAQSGVQGPLVAPRLRGILFDRPHVVEGARQILNAAGVVDRCELVGGSFFDAVPAGGDAYLLRHIIHNWEDDQAVAILTNCRRAMATGARVLLAWSASWGSVARYRST
jgi:hypothetical protein